MIENCVFAACLFYAYNLELHKILGKRKNHPNWWFKGDLPFAQVKKHEKTTLNKSKTNNTHPCILHVGRTSFGPFFGGIKRSRIRIEDTGPEPVLKVESFFFRTSTPWKFENGYPQ